MDVARRQHAALALGDGATAVAVCQRLLGTTALRPLVDCTTALFAALYARLTAKEGEEGEEGEEEGMVVAAVA